jgi:hypothetical protein
VPPVPAATPPGGGGGGGGGGAGGADDRDPVPAWERAQHWYAVVVLLRDGARIADTGAPVLVRAPITSPPSHPAPGDVANGWWWGGGGGNHSIATNSLTRPPQ